MIHETNARPLNVNQQSELPFVRDMFDHIAPRYDFLNRLLSLRRDVFWRRVLVHALELTAASQVLDVACGTCDVGLAIMEGLQGRVSLIGVDFSTRMLALAKTKLTKSNQHQAIRLAAADAFWLPFARSSFDAVTMAFGIRNIQNKLAALQGLREVLKPGGRLAILELVTPESGVLRSIYLTYFNRLLPFIGRFFSKHHFAYTYLPDSVAHFPSAPGFARLMRQAGFEHVRYRCLTLGVAVVFIGDKGGIR
jgi:demethylmenaquinone methyltransferase/2-methoxy-6-polyprenyl-1,4-benzoquinol methylase